MVRVMRLFIALKLNEAIKDALWDVTDAMRAQSIRANYVPEENLHVTLAFLGEVAPGTIPAIEEAICSVPFTPLTLATGEIGNFGNLLYVGLAENDSLHRYVSLLRQALDHSGIDFDHKKFKAHITIARKVQGERPFRLQVKKEHMTAHGVSLFRSDRVNGGMRYSEIGYYS